MFLTAEQLEDMTGYQRHADQVRWLAGNGYRFDVRADGRPNVLRRQVIERQCNSAPESESKPVPNLDALKKTG